MSAPGPSPSLLIISHACTVAVNRQPYADLQALGWRVRVVAAAELLQDGKIRAADPQEPDAPTVAFLRLVGHSPRTYRFAGLYDKILSFRPQWVIADNDPHSILALQLAAWKRELGYRLGFVSCENLPFTLGPLWHRRGARGLALGIFCAAIRWRVRPQTDLLWTINDAGTRLFRDAGFARVEKTPLGFPDRHFVADSVARTATRERLALKGPVVAYFGRLSPEKGVHLLLDALEGIDAPWSLLIDAFMPSSAYQAGLRTRLAQPPWASRVQWIEARHGEVGQYMNAADVVVLPSISTTQWVEQYGRVAPEAMACGCLVVAANAGALPELVGDVGKLFPEGDVSALREILREALIDLPSFHALRTAAAKRSHAMLSSSAQARLWAKTLC